MLANPVVIPAYAAAPVWCLAGIAMWAEIRTELVMLRRSGWGPDVWGSLLLINIMTWLVFLIAVDALGDRRDPVLTISLLEVGVVVVEAALFWLALRRRANTGAGAALSIGRSLAISLVGNLVSIAVSIALPLAFWGLNEVGR